MPDRLRTGITGCGKVGAIHANALSTLPESEFRAVCDSDPRRAEDFGQRFCARPYTSTKEMVERERLNVVVVCTPHPLHAAPTVEAASAGAHVLVEKPLACRLADCDLMIQAARAANVRLGVVSQRRFFEPVLRIKQAIDEGRIGRPVLGTVVLLNWRDEAYYRSDPWRGRWDTEGGGVLVNQSPHHLDILRWFMGPVEEVTGYAANLNHPYVEVEDTAVAALRFHGGGLGSIVASLSQKPGIHGKIHIHGSNGASVGVETDTGASFVAGMSGITQPPLNDLWTIPGEEGLLAQFEREDRQRLEGVAPVERYHQMQVRDFLRAILEARAPLVTGEDGRAVVEMFEAIYRSSRTGAPQRFPIPQLPE
jgi:predicted dehydrogenase